MNTSPENNGQHPTATNLILWFIQFKVLVAFAAICLCIWAFWSTALAAALFCTGLAILLTQVPGNENVKTLFGFALGAVGFWVGVAGTFHPVSSVEIVPYVVVSGLGNRDLVVDVNADDCIYNTKREHLKCLAQVREKPSVMALKPPLPKP